MLRFSDNPVRKQDIKERLVSSSGRQCQGAGEQACEDLVVESYF
jgi:hypothetical protein